MQHLWTLLVCVLPALAFDKKRASIDATYSAYAYCGADNYEKVSWDGDVKGFEVERVLFQGLHDVEGYVGYNSKSRDIMVVFRGSASAPNWVTNLDIRKVEYPHCEQCMVHEGFYHATTTVYDQVHSAVSSLHKKYRSYSIRVTGHSLGGALALLTALELQADGFHVLHESFGSPRSGNEAFAAYADKALDYPNRFVHNRDLVPHCPPEIFGFYHTSPEIWQKADGSYAECFVGQEDPACSNSCLHTSTDDHFYYVDMRIVQCPDPAYRQDATQSLQRDPPRAYVRGDENDNEVLIM